MVLEKILVVEDDVNHQKYAKEVLGDKLIGIVSSYREFNDFLKEKKIDGVLSDFYFPSGYEGTTKHKGIIMREDFPAIISNYMVSTNLYENPIGNVIEAIRKTKVLGNTLLEVYNNLKDDESFFINSGFDETIKSKLEQYQKFLDYQNLIDTINDGTHQAPLGLTIKKKCDEKNIPVIIVTDSYHHGTDFQPFVNITGEYIDTLDENGEKPWLEAYERIENK